MAISFDAIGEKYVTFAAGENAEAGKVCKVDAEQTVNACAQGDAFCGVIANVRGDAAAVIMGGYTEIVYSGSVPGYGYVKLAADANGGVKADDGGREYLVVHVDETNGMIGLFL